MSLMGKWITRRLPDNSLEVTGRFDPWTMPDSMFVSRMTLEVVEEVARRYVKENYAELKKSISAKDVKDAIVEATAREFINKAFKD